MDHKLAHEVRTRGTEGRTATLSRAASILMCSSMRTRHPEGAACDSPGLYWASIVSTFTKGLRRYALAFPQP